MVSQRLYDEDRGLWGKIRDFFAGLVEKLKKAYAELNPDCAIARKVKETVTRSEAVVNAWAEAVSDAAANYQFRMGKKMTPGRAKMFYCRSGDPLEKICRNGLIPQLMKKEK